VSAKLNLLYYIPYYAIFILVSIISCTNGVATGVTSDVTSSNISSKSFEITAMSMSLFSFSVPFA